MRISRKFHRKRTLNGCAIEFLQILSVFCGGGDSRWRTNAIRREIAHKTMHFNCIIIPVLYGFVCCFLFFFQVSTSASLKNLGIVKFYLYTLFVSVFLFLFFFFIRAIRIYIYYTRTRLCRVLFILNLLFSLEKSTDLYNEHTTRRCNALSV